MQAGGWPPGPPQGGYVSAAGYGASGAAPSLGLPSAFWLGKNVLRPGRWILHEYFTQGATYGPRRNDLDYSEQQEQEKHRQLEQLEGKRQKAALKQHKYGGPAAIGAGGERGEHEPQGAGAAAGSDSLPQLLSDAGVGGVSGSEGKGARKAQGKGGMGNSQSGGGRNMQGQQSRSSKGQGPAAGGSSSDPMGYGEGKQAVSFPLDDMEGQVSYV